MKSIADKPPLWVLIVVACSVGGIISLLSTLGSTSYWSDRDFWIMSISSHSALIGITFWIYRGEKLSLNTRVGLFNTLTLALISSVTALFLIALGIYVPFLLIITGRAFITAFAATIVYAVLRQIQSETPRPGFWK